MNKKSFREPGQSTPGIFEDTGTGKPIAEK
jgi:hypothetical protein